MLYLRIEFGFLKQLFFVWKLFMFLGITFLWYLGNAKPCSCIPRWTYPASWMQEDFWTVEGSPWFEGNNVYPFQTDRLSEYILHGYLVCTKLHQYCHFMLLASLSAVCMNSLRRFDIIMGFYITWQLGVELRRIKLMCWVNFVLLVQFVYKQSSRNWRLLLQGISWEWLQLCI